MDALAVLVKVVNLAGFREPLAVFIHCPERQQNVGVWVSISLVVDGKVSNHAFGNKLLLTKIFEHGKILVFRNFSRKCQHDAAGKLGVPLVLHGFHAFQSVARSAYPGGAWVGSMISAWTSSFFLL